MVSSVDFKVDSILVIAYVASSEFVPAEILRHAMNTWSDLYDADPVSIPLPPGVPPELPSVILSSRDGGRRLEVARTRVSAVIPRTATQATLDIDRLLPELAKHMNAVFNHAGVSIGRLAVVVHRTAEDPAPAMTIARHYFQKKMAQSSTKSTART